MSPIPPRFFCFDATTTALMRKSRYACLSSPDGPRAMNKRARVVLLADGAQGLGEKRAVRGHRGIEPQRPTSCPRFCLASVRPGRAPCADRLDLGPRCECTLDFRQLLLL